MPITPAKVMQIDDASFGGKLDAKVFYAQYLRFLKSDTLGKFITATIKNRETYMQSGTAIYTRNYMPQWEKYGDGTSPKRDMKASRFTVSIDQFQTAKWEWEDFDLSMIEAGEFTSAASEGLALASIALMDAEAMEYARDVAIANKNYMKIATFSTTTDKSQMESDNLKWVDSSTDLINVIDQCKIGTAKADLITVMGPKAHYRRIKGFGITGGDVIPNKLISGELQEVAGWKIMVSQFIGKSIAAGQSFSMDKAYDFSKIEAISLNTEALAMPYGINVIKNTRNPVTANDGIVAKLSYGKGVIYSELVKVYVNEYPTLAELNASLLNVTGKANTYADEGAAKAAGYSLAGDSKDPTMSPVVMAASLDDAEEILKSLDK